MRIRGDLANALDAEEVAERAARLRGPRQVTPSPGDEAGTRVQDVRPLPEVLALALARWPRPQMACHQDVLAELMGWEQIKLGREMRNVGLPATPVRMVRPETDDRSTTPGRGYYLVDIEAKVRELQ
jgi:hypothetical protein